MFVGIQHRIRDADAMLSRSEKLAENAPPKDVLAKQFAITLGLLHTARTKSRPIGVNDPADCESTIASSAGASITLPGVTIFSGPNDIVILRGLDIDGGSLAGGNFPLISFSGSGTLRLGPRAWSWNTLVWTSNCSGPPQSFAGRGGGWWKRRTSPAAHSSETFMTAPNSSWWQHASAWCVRASRLEIV